ncbi:MAG: KdsC family phosphatase [Planctomycetota bacterium]
MTRLREPLAAARDIEVILVDVDGVLTDGGIILGVGGFEAKRFHSRDGHGLAIARSCGLKTGIITGRSSEAVTQRARELGMDFCIQGEKDKVAAFNRLKAQTGLNDTRFAYIGDDLQDAPLLRLVGFAGTVMDGARELDQVVHWRSAKSGGQGAIREFVEYILKAQGRWEGVLTGFGLTT